MLSNMMNAKAIELNTVLTGLVRALSVWLPGIARFIHLLYRRAFYQ